VNRFLRPLSGSGHTCSLINERTGSVIASVVEPALNATTRRRGLLGRDRLDDGHALLLAPCGSVHTIGMRFTIDVLFVGPDGRVVKIVEQLRSWRIAGAMRACFTVELPAGSLSRSDVSPGDRLTLQPANASSVQ
jgi:uncharacterized membrane protein (UPF0127 family)